MTPAGWFPPVAGLTFRYALHELPPGRVPFRRVRWELWHGERLEAAGWRTTERDAARSLRRHGERVARRIFGLAPITPPTRGLEPFPPGAAVHIDQGPVHFALVPAQLDAPIGTQPIS